MSIESSDDLEGLRRAGHVTRLTLDALEQRVRAGMTTGQLDTVALERMLAAPGTGRRVRLVAVSHVPTHSGLVQPAEAIGVVVGRQGDARTTPL